MTGIVTRAGVDADRSDPGIIIGALNLPVVNQGDGLFNLALVTDPDATAEAVDIFQEDWEQNSHVFEGVDTT